MVAFIQPPKKIRRSPHLRHVHQVLATALLPSKVVRPEKKIAAWKAWTFVGWVMIVALWGVGRTILAIY